MSLTGISGFLDDPLQITNISGNFQPTARCNVFAEDTQESCYLSQVLRIQVGSLLFSKNPLCLMLSKLRRKGSIPGSEKNTYCLLYTSDAADE